MQSTDGQVTLLCPFEPGNLQSCYYGEWRKGSTIIISIGGPNFGDCAPGDITSVNGTKYQLNRENFALTISSVKATDSDNYECQLRILDPASPTGVTISFRNVTVSLTVDGK